MFVVLACSVCTLVVNESEEGTKFPATSANRYEGLGNGSAHTAKCRREDDRDEDEEDEEDEEEVAVAAVGEKSFPGEMLQVLAFEGMTSPTCVTFPLLRRTGYLSRQA
jgi:hypothetical protein